MIMIQGLRYVRPRGPVGPASGEVGGAKMPDAVTVEVGGGVAVLTINRPQARNAVNEAVASGIAAPIDAAVEGYALAGGFEIALACDLIVASEEATFGLPEVTRGLVASAGGLLRLPRRIPYHLAMEIALTGRHVPAGRLHEAGLINRLVPAGEALGAARVLAAEVAANAPLALAATKRIIVESADWPSDEAFA